jgi:hypothetical protein
MDQQNQTIPEGHITLKEAARISGYAPDYVGQLIRKGKLYGRQVYVSTAWVTTEDAVRKYLAGEATGPEAATGSPELGAAMQFLENRMLSDVRVSGAIRLVLYGAIAASVCLTLMLFYIVSVGIEHRLGERAVERAQKEAELAP